MREPSSHQFTDTDGSGFLAPELRLPGVGQLRVAAADVGPVYIAMQALVCCLFNLIGLLRQLVWG